MLRASARLGVLASGEGTNLQALIDAIGSGNLPAEIALVLSDRPDAPALKRAASAGIAAELVDPGRFPDREKFDLELARKLKENKVDLVILAGYMRIVTRPFLQEFPNRIINIHPALLPDDPEAGVILLPDGTKSKIFRGMQSVKQAIEAGASWTGCTVHLVTEKVDQGPVLLREFVPVKSGDSVDSLHARIQEKEHEILPRAVRQIIQNKGKPLPGQAKNNFLFF